MSVEIVRFPAEDGVELVGFYAGVAGARRAILHTHGMAGNFYENRFIDHIVEAAVARGVAFLAVNNRGHDYLSDNLRGVGESTEVVRGGVVWDAFQESVLDIGACASFLRDRGHEGIYYEGHSLGASKTVYYLTERPDAEAAGVILLSPPDIFGLRDDGGDGHLSEAVRKAERLVRDGLGETLMTEVEYAVPLTAHAVAATYGDPSASDIFPVRLGDGGDYVRLGSIRAPLLVIYGTVEEAVTIPVEEAAALIERHAESTSAVRVALVQGGNHMYWGHEAEIGWLVGEFVGSESAGAAGVATT